MKFNPKIVLIIITYVAFIALGMPDGLLGVAWNSIRTGFAVPLDSAGLLLLAVVAGYLISSVLSGPLVSRFGVGKILTWSCLLTGISLLGYTLVPYWWMVIALGVIAGFGAGAIDSGLNAYAAANFNERLMQWLHASYGIGITLGPLLMTSTLLYMNSWRAGYQIVGSFQILLSICFALLLPVWKQNDFHNKTNEEKVLTNYIIPLSETLKQPRVWLSVALFFLYTGTEVSFGIWAYSLLVNSRKVSTDVAGLLVSSYWAVFTIGRIFAGILTKHIGINKMVLFGLLVALFSAGLLLLNASTLLNLITVPLIGLAIAPIFPALVSETTQRVGIKYSANTIGMQMAAGAIGTAAVPGILGIFARRISYEVIPLCIMILFLMLVVLYSLSKRKTQI